MAYAPKNRIYRIKWKILLPVFIVISLLAYAGISFFQQKQESKEKYTVCGLTPERTAQLLNRFTKETIAVSDYVYYGESLGLYEQPYSPLHTDTLSGKTVILHNLCDDSEVTMTMENTADQKILLDEIQEGFYNVVIIDNLVKKQVVFQEPIKENTFHTVVRNGHTNEISIIADKDLLKDQDITMKYHAMFLQVTEKDPDPEEIDVVIDPHGMNIDITNVPDKGNQGNGIVENDAMFEAAQMLKKELESYGLRVGVTKSNKDEVIATYGEHGRLSKGYDKKAKYYLYLRMNASSTQEAKGMEIWHSSYSSPTLAKTMMYHMERDKVITPSSMYFEDYNAPGIAVSQTMVGSFDKNQIYDQLIQLRESGGRATLTGRVTETSVKENQKFKDADGMLGLELDFAYISNAQDAKNWKNNKDKIIQSCAKAFIKGIHATETK